MSQEIKICSADSGYFLGGLSANDTMATQNMMVACCGFKKLGGSSGQFLKADGSTDSASYTTCTGDVTGIDAGTAITVSDGTTSTPCVGVTTSCNSAWNAKTTCTGTLVPSDLAGLTCCTGTTTPSNAQTFTNKSGSNSQWTNDAGYTTCTGTLVSSDLAGLTCCTGTTTPSNTQTFTNKSGNISQWTNNTGYTTCVGDITGVTAGNGLSGGATTGTATLALDGDCLAGLNQSACPGINKTGTVTCIAAGNGLTGGTSGSGTMNVGAGTAITVAADTVGVTSACNTAWNNKTTCTGTTTPSNTQTFTNKSGSNSQWTNDAGYTGCTGTVTGIAAGNAGIDVGSGTCPSVSLDLSELADGTAAVVPTSDEVIYLDAGTQKRKLFSEIFGNNAYNSTTIATNNNQLTNGAGYTTCTGTLVASDISGLTCCTGTTTASNVQTFTNKSGNISQWTNNSGYTTCTGTLVPSDISGLTTCTGTTTPSNTQTFTNKSGNISQWTNNSGYTTCNGDITGVSVGSGLAGGGTSGSVTLCVDSTVARTNVDETFSCDVVINGDLTVSGDFTCLETIVSVTSALSVTNNGSGPGLFVCQAGSAPVVNFVDAEVGSSFYIENGGFVGLGDTNPGHKLDVSGNINATGSYKLDDSDVINSGKCFVGAQVRPTTDIADAYIASASTWNAKTTCTGTLVPADISGLTCCLGTTTPSNTQTFTNKSGSNNQWTNDRGYTTCTGTLVASDISGLTCCTGTVTGITAGNAGIDVGTGTTPSVSLDLSELADGTGAIVTGTDEIIYLDAGTQKRKRFSEIFGNNAYNSTTIATNNNQLTNGAGYTTCTGTLVASDISGLTCCTGTTTPSNTQTFTNKSGSNSQWTNDAGYTTCTGDITNVSAGTLLDGGGSSGSVTLNVDLSELADGTAAIVPSTDEIVYLDGGSQKRKLFSEIFGCNAYNSTGFTTCIGTVVAGDISGFTSCTGTTTPSNVQTFTNKSGNISQWTNNSGYTTCTGTVVAGDISGFTSCTGTTTPSNTQTFTNKSGSISQWTNNSGYTTCTGTLVASDISGLTCCTGTVTSVGISPGTGLDAGGAITGSGTIAVSLDLSELTDMTGGIDTAVDEIILLDNGAERRKRFAEIFGSNAYNSTTIATNNNQLTNGAGYTTCTGDITGVSVGTGLAGGGTSGSVTLCINSTCNSTWNGKTTCTGTTTPSNTQTFTNKSGNISQWTNNSGYTTCTGDITGVTAGAGLSGGATSGTATVALDGAMVATLNQSGCSGLNCVGDITNVGVSTGLAGGGSSGSVTLCIDSTCNSTWNGKTTCTGTTTPSNTQTFTNKSGNISQWTNDSGYTTCTGDITGVTAGTLLDGGGSSGSVTLNVDLSELTDGTAAIVPTSDEVVYLDGGSQKRKLFSEIFGCNAYSNTAFTTCTGDITSVTAGNGLTGGASSGGATLNVGAGTAITVAADTVGVTTACNTAWNAKTTCTGTVTSIATGTGLDGTFTTSGTITLDLSELTDMTGGIDTAVDEIILLDNGAERRKRFAEIFGSNAYNSTTIPTNNNQLTNGNGYTTCTGTVVASDISSFTSCTGTVTSVNGDGSTITVTNGTTDACVGVHADCDTAWNAKTTCTGTTTPSNSQTFTNKSGNISQWTNDANYTANATTCTGNLCGATSQCIFDTAENFCIGPNAGEDLTSGGNNTMIGQCAGRCITSGSHNISIGSRAGEKNCTKNYNVSLGYQAGFCGSGCGNTAIGQQALQNSIASNSVAIGKCTLYSATGNSNVAIGSQAFQNMSSGINNFGLGGVAGFAMSTGSNNVFIGECAGRYNTSGSNNIMLGRRSGRCYTGGNKTSGTGNVYLGQDTKGGTSTSSCEIVIGDGACGCGTNTAMIGNSNLSVVCSNGSFSTVSDRRDKTCICDLEFGLDFIGNLKPKTFNMITDRNDPEGSISCKRHGFIAQDVLALEGSDPVIIRDDNPDRLGYTGEHIIPILVKGMQEQQAVIDNLTARLEALEG